MSVQEAALYGDLVLALRDYAATQMADASAVFSTGLAPEHCAEAARARLDDFIRTWFFTPQEELYGSAPREVIWREQLGEENLLPREYTAELYHDDCPICRAMREQIENAEDDEAYSSFWGYSPDTCLLDIYDPEGSAERWRKEFARMEEAQEAQGPDGFAPEHMPPSISPSQLSPDEFLSAMRRSWPDPEQHHAAQRLVERCDVPQPPMPGGPPYRRITPDEASSVVAGLQQQGVGIQALLAEIDAWPYENVALDWLSDPERHVALICRAMDGAASGDGDELVRFHHHRDFILDLARLVPPGARLWLSGWLEAVTYGAMAWPF
jgi:hypothetical protein